MTDESSIASHLSVVMTTAQATQNTGETTLTSSSSRGADFYFGCAVIIIGVVGTAANALVLYAMVASKQHKRHALIVNQNVLDLSGSLLLVVTYALKISDLYLTGSLGYWICMMIISENLLWCALQGSVFNLAVITVDRYLKVVHPIWSRKHLRKWTTYCLVASPWIIGIIFNMSVTFETSAVIDGVCHGLTVWEDRVLQMVHGVIFFACFYGEILVIFVLCYWRILTTIRRQAKVMASHNAAGTAQSNTANAQTRADHRVQSNVIKPAMSESHCTQRKPFSRTVHPVLWYAVLCPDSTGQTRVNKTYNRNS